MDDGCTHELTTAMESLVPEVRAVVRRARDAREASGGVARVLEASAGQDELLTAGQRRARSDGYTQHLVHVDEKEAFSIVSLVWLPGQETPVHDHIAWCVPAVHEGREAEIHYSGVSRADGMLEAPGHESEVDYLVEKDRRTNRAGDVTALTPPGDIHRVWNPGPEKAISIHVYGADISQAGTSIRRCYDQPVRREEEGREGEMTG